MKLTAFKKIARQLSIRGFVAAVCAALWLPLSMCAQAAGRQALHGHVPAVVMGLQPVEHYPGTNRLNLAIGLPLRNREALAHLLRELYDPASPNYHHYLTPEQFTAQFGPTEQDYAAVMAFAQAHGLRVTATHPNRMLLDVNGSVADIEKALHVTLRVYQHPMEHRRFHAPDTEPSLDLTPPILGISGLDDYSLPRPRLQATPLANGQNVSPNAGSGPGSTYMGKDFRAAYVPDTSLNGSGQIVGLLQFDGYTASDITYYENLAGLPSITLSNVLIDGASGGPSGSGGEVEVSLDIEMAISMATNLSKVVVYMAPNPSPWEDLLSRMADDTNSLGQPNVRQLSCSWYEPGGAAKPTCDVYFQKMAAQGQSFFNASGDYDAYTGLIDFPGDTPYLTQVGGTTLTTSGPGGAWVSETVWNRGNGIGSGGGISTQYPIPGWQTNISMTANQGSTTMRNTPDVALTAESVYVRADGINYTVGGTSCAAPLWAGFAALVNQQAVATGKPTVGFINPLVDVIGSGANYPSAFHDITTGNNTSPGSPSRFYAVSGYDLCTGWGTPAGQNLINALANPEALVITPASGFSALGGAGGPFTVTSQSLSLTNVGTNTLGWTLVNTSLWLNASPSSGLLTPGGPATTVILSLNSAASNLVVGTYSATVWFTNLTSGVGQSRQYSLSVISPPTITTQPTDQAVLDGATATFTVGVTGGLPLYYQWQDNGTNLTDGGNISGSTTSNLTISNASSAYVGAYSVIVSNAAAVVVSSNALLTITPSPPVIILQPTNQTVVVGRTAQFSVAALGNKPFFYQWSFNGTNIDGATNVVLTLTDVQFGQAGNYAVAVTNILGSVLSSNAMLTVIPTPPCTPPASGIVSWWPGEGNANDVVGTNNGVLEGLISFGAGEVGQAFLFNNTNADVRVPASASLNVGAGNGFTVEAWINPSDVSQLHPLFEWNNGSGAFGVHFYISVSAGPGTFYANVVDSGGSWHRFSSPVAPLTTNVFQHVALTYDKASGMGTIYCNGAMVAQQNIGSFTPLTTYNLYLGRRPPGGSDTYTFAGLLDEPSLYNRALSSNEIAAIYNADSGGKCPPSPTPPAITTQPTNQTVTVGGTAIFGVTASGTPPLSYQWNFNTTNIVGATNATLTLANVQLSQAGNYAVLVTNSYGSVLSSNALLTVTLPPTNCDPPPSGIVSWWPAEGNANDIVGTNNGVLEGLISFGAGEVGQAFFFNNTNADVRVPASASLNVGAGSGFTVEAWINPSDVSQLHPLFEWNNGSGAFGVHFYISVSAGSGTFYANVVDSGGHWHQFSSPVAPLTTNVFQHVALTYDKASGVVAIYYNGAVIAQGNLGSFTPLTTYNLYLGRRPPGGSDTYTFAGLLDEPSLYNRALSSNEIAAIYNAGSGGKCPPTPPWIATQPTNQTVVVGQTAVFTVGASGALPLSYQWKFNGTNLVGATNTVLTLTNVQLTQTGNYAVLVTNLYGSTNSANAVLAVGIPPTILTQPASQAVALGCDATFKVYARGTNPLSYQWKFNGTNLVGTTNTSLTLTNVQTSDFGSYLVTVANLFGSVTSSPALLALGHPPVAGADTIYRFAAGGVRVNASVLLANDTDVDGNGLTIIGVSPNSTGGGSVGLTNNWVYYAPPTGSTNSGAFDTFTYVLSDGHCGTDEGAVTVQVRADNPQPVTFAIANPGDGSVRLAFDGIPGYDYWLEYTGDLSNPDWQTLATQPADGFGVCQFVDWSLTNAPVRFYRAVWP